MSEPGPGTLTHDDASAGSPIALPPLSMTTEAQEAWSTLLAGLAPRLEAPGGRDREIFAAGLDTLAAARCAEPVFSERPAWLDDEALARLQAEAAAIAMRPTAQPSKAYGRIGRDGLIVVLNKGLRAWVGEVLGLRIGRHASASYIAYQYDPQALVASRLHIDLPEYEINCLIGVQHVAPDDGLPSVLRIFDRGHQPRDLVLSPGAVVAFDACRTPHSRTALRAGEQVTLLSVGLRVERLAPHVPRTAARTESLWRSSADDPSAATLPSTSR